MSTCRHVEKSEISVFPYAQGPGWGGTWRHLAWLFQLSHSDKPPFHSQHSTSLATFLCFLLVVLPLEMAPKCHADLPSSTPKGTNTVVRFTETIPALSKLCSGLSVLLSLVVVV